MMIFGRFSCTISCARPPSHSDGLTTLQVLEALHEGGIQKATAHLRSISPVEWLEIHQFLMLSYKPYKPRSSSDLKATLSNFLFFRSDKQNFWVKSKVIEQLQRSEPANKNSLQPSQIHITWVPLILRKLLCIFPKIYLSNILGPHGTFLFPASSVPGVWSEAPFAGGSWEP